MPLFGSKTVDELPPRIQRFRIRLMKYSFKILHVPVQELVTADTLSRALLDKQLSKEDERLNEDLNLYVSHILECFPAREKKLGELDSTNRMMKYAENYLNSVSKAGQMKQN